MQLAYNKEAASQPASHRSMDCTYDMKLHTQRTNKISSDKQNKTKLMKTV